MAQSLSGMLLRENSCIRCKYLKGGLLQEHIASTERLLLLEQAKVQRVYGMSLKKNCCIDQKDIQVVLVQQYLVLMERLLLLDHGILQLIYGMPPQGKNYICYKGIKTKYIQPYLVLMERLLLLDQTMQFVCGMLLREKSCIYCKVRALVLMQQSLGLREGLCLFNRIPRQMSIASGNFTDFQWAVLSRQYYPFCFTAGKKYCKKLL